MARRKAKATVHGEVGGGLPGSESPKRRGRPPKSAKIPIVENGVVVGFYRDDSPAVPPTPKKRGRPKKVQPVAQDKPPKPKRSKPTKLSSLVTEIPGIVMDASGPMTAVGVDNATTHFVEVTHGEGGTFDFFLYSRDGERDKPVLKFQADAEDFMRTISFGVNGVRFSGETVSVTVEATATPQPSRPITQQRIKTLYVSADIRTATEAELVDAVSHSAFLAVSEPSEASFGGGWVPRVSDVCDPRNVIALGPDGAWFAIRYDRVIGQTGGK